MAGLPTIDLSSGHKIPILAYGLGTRWYKKTPGDIDENTLTGVKLALKLGYRHIDGAQIYNNEAEIGQAITASGIPRSEIFLTTKAKDWSDIADSLKTSLELLQTSYVDLYLIHFPFGASIEQLQTAWAAMESTVSLGLARSIGVSNFAIPQLQIVLETAKIIPAVNQIELHPYLPQEELRVLMRDKGIGLEAYGPVTPLTRAAPGPIDPVVERIAEKYGVEDTVVLLRWVVDQGYVAVSTSGKEERLVGMLRDVPKVKLTQEEVEELREVGKGKTHRQFLETQFKVMGVNP